MFSIRDRPPRGLVVAALALCGLALGLLLWVARVPGAELAWAATTVLVLGPLVLSVGRQVRAGSFGADVIALLAMAGSLALGQFLAGAVIGLMLAGGQALEGYASARARRELTALLGRAPRTAHRYQDGALDRVPLDGVRRGDRLLVKPGEVVPVDGVVLGPAVLDESALTGEALPVDRLEGDAVRSGVVNAGAPFDMRAVASAEQSTYAAIVRLVKAAQASRAPFVRIADRYAAWFLPLALLTAAAGWALARDPIRALAVLVVATPCPLILAAPVAIVAGISRAARSGVIVKGGAPLEALGAASVVIFDKTGTLTAGMPRVAEVRAIGTSDPGRVLALAASLDQLSSHVFAGPIVAAARAQGLRLCFPENAQEHPGLGISGAVEGVAVGIGRAAWVAGGAGLPPEAERLRREAEAAGRSCAFVSLDGRLAGAIVLEDPVRPEAARSVTALREAGVRRVLVLSGDREPIAQRVGVQVGADAAFGEQTPDGKVALVTAQRRQARAQREGTVVMVGDGINDAPALASADVGVAMGARGATASSEAADVVVIVDSVDRVAFALRLARRTRAIATQSVVAGMGLSLFGMALAALGLLSPVSGALFQEAIDVAVILNALRALGGGEPAAATRAPVTGPPALTGAVREP